MIEQLTRNLKARTAHCITEEELRLAWLHELQNALGMTFQAERGRNDASHNQVIIEFKSKGLFGGKESSPEFKERDS